MMKKKCSLLLLCFILWVAMINDNRSPITIFMIGDSTMANKSLEGGNPERGWGQMLPEFLTGDIIVDNHAQNGRSSKSFIDEGRWDTVVAKIKAGDYVFIQFGHNDEKTDAKRYTEPGTTFDANLKRFVSETRAKGGIPVLFNSIARRNFNAEGQLIDTHGAYLESPRNVAKEMNVPFIDMNKITHNLMQEMGVEESKKLLMWVEPNTVPAIPNGREDNTHLNIYGGRVVAGLTIDAIAEAIPELAKYVRKSNSLMFDLKKTEI